MPAHPLSDTLMIEALEAVSRCGNISDAARSLGIPRPTLQNRYDRARLAGISPRRDDAYPYRLNTLIENGAVIVFSDAHYFPGEPSTAHRALLQAIKEFRPRLVVLNGDAFDGASISRWPRIGWDHKPTVKQELQAVEERLSEIEKAAGDYAQKVWTLGNHDARFETFLAANAPQYEGVEGFHLKDHFPHWKPAWRLDINPGSDHHTIIKHRIRSGIGAKRNNVLKTMTHTVTGHLHDLGVHEVTSARGTLYGVDTGCLAETVGHQFADYTEDGVTGWVSGFAVLTYKDGRLLRPETVRVACPGVVEFRGKEYSV